MLYAMLYCIWTHKKYRLLPHTTQCNIIYLFSQIGLKNVWINCNTFSNIRCHVSIHLSSLSSVYASLTTAAQQCNQLTVHERARTKAGKFGLTRQWGPEPFISALALSWGLMACDRLFLTDSVTNFSIPVWDFWTFSSCHTSESHDPIDQSAFWWSSFQQVKL